MRNRKAIENDIFGRIDEATGLMQWLQLEVLLDIRDLLIQPTHDFPVKLTDEELEELKKDLSRPWGKKVGEGN